jgi:hypothetical protein
MQTANRRLKMTRFNSFRRAAAVAATLATVGLAGMGLNSTAAFAQNADAQFVLVNASRQTIDAIQVSPVTNSVWGPDALGRNTVLPSGYSIVLTPFADACRFDIKVTFHDGASDVYRNVDLCDVGSITVRNNHYYVVS